MGVEEIRELGKIVTELSSDATVFLIWWIAASIATPVCWLIFGCAFLYTVCKTIRRVVSVESNFAKICMAYYGEPGLPNNNETEEIANFIRKHKDK